MVRMAHVPSDANSPHGSPRSVLRRPLIIVGAVVLATAAFAGVGAAAMAATPASTRSADPAPLIQAAVAEAKALTPQAPPASAADGRRVAVVGDSLIFTTAAEQATELRHRGYDATVQGNPGKPLSDPWIQGRLGESRGRDIVVMATASNDNVELANRTAQVGNEQAGAEYAGRLETTIEQVGAPCTVIVDVRTRTGALYHPETAATTNARLRQVAASHRAVVVPWSAVSDGHDQRDWFVADELHFINGSQRQDAGVQAYTQAIANGVDQCASLLDAK